MKSIDQLLQILAAIIVGAAMIIGLYNMERPQNELAIIQTELSRRITVGCFKDSTQNIRVEYNR